MLSRDATQVVLEYLPIVVLWKFRDVSKRWHVIIKRFIKQRIIRHNEKLKYSPDILMNNVFDPMVLYHMPPQYNSALLSSECKSFGSAKPCNKFRIPFYGDYIKSFRLVTRSRVSFLINESVIYTKELDAGEHAIYDYPIAMVVFAYSEFFLIVDAPTIVITFIVGRGPEQSYVCDLMYRGDKN
jgi:hypothetical protein